MVAADTGARSDANYLVDSEPLPVAISIARSEVSPLEKRVMRAAAHTKDAVQIIASN